MKVPAPGPGWTLAPAFDINPNPTLEAQRITSVGGAGNPADEVKALLLYSETFGLTRAEAGRILREVADATNGWEVSARRNGIAEAEIGHFASTLTQTIGAVHNG